jgi:multiple sugar transport system permease protein
MAVAVAGHPTGHQGRMRRLLGRDPIGYAFIAPYVLFLGGLFAYPLLVALYISFFDYFFAAPGAHVARPFVGLSNYAAVLSDPVFQRSILNVAEFILINVPLTVLLSLVLASALNAKLPFRTFFRVAYYIPYVTASVAVIGVWLWLFSGGGFLNGVLGPLSPTPSWLVNELWAMPVIALVVTWKQLGFYVLLYLAALQNIPRELYEASEVDGAGVVRRFTAITVPGVRSVTTLVVILATIVGANLFTEPYLLTGGGGPNGASMSPVLLMYQQGIEQGHAGYAAAIGIVLAIVVMAISAFNRFVLERE